MMPLFLLAGVEPASLSPCWPTALYKAFAGACRAPSDVRDGQVRGMVIHAALLVTFAGIRIQDLSAFTSPSRIGVRVGRHAHPSRTPLIA